MEIPDQYVGWLVTAWGAIVTWLITLERRLLARPTRQEQEAIASRVAVQISIQFNEIKKLLEKQNVQMEKKDEQTALHRELMGASIAEIRTRVAVLQARAGGPSETGPHRRQL